MIQIRIAFVLRLVDDFTGACIKRKSFRFWTDEKILHPVQKEEGLYVFLEPLEHPARITIEGTDYYPCTVEVDKHILDPEEPIADIRLYGRSGKVYSGGREYRTGVLNIKGQELPAEVYIRREKPTGLMYREYRKLENSHWILFQGFTKEDLIGKTAIAIVNLPPRKMMGIDSEGMLISAVYEYDGREGLNLLMLDDSIPAGAKLY